MTLTAVARSLGLDTSSVTYYFKRKDQLAAACIDRTLQWQADAARRAASEPNPRSRVRAFLHEHIALHRMQRDPGKPQMALLSDMRSLVVMRDTNCPVVFDATHSVQLPGGQGDKSGGQREFVPALSRAAVAVGVAGVFMETHPDPDKALSDGPNAWPLGRMENLLSTLKAIDDNVKQQPFEESLL